MKQRKPHTSEVLKAVDDLIAASERYGVSTTRNVIARGTRRKHAEAIREAENRLYKIIAKFGGPKLQ